MNDRWVLADGSRWQKPERVRSARRFRHHVRSPSNPRGRIVRLSCEFWQRKVKRKDPVGRVAKVDANPSCLGDPADFHHVDYDRPFVGVWLCRNCHRKVDHGSLRLTAKMIHDYTSLVANVERPGGRVERRGRGVRARSDAPF